MISDFLSWVSLQDFKNRKIAQILQASLQTLLSKDSDFEKGNIFKVKTIFKCIMPENCVLCPWEEESYFDFRLITKYPAEKNIQLVQTFRIYDDGTISFKGMISRLENTNKNETFEMIILKG